MWEGCAGGLAHLGALRPGPPHVVYTRRRRYVALEVAYFGGAYQGFARQDGPSGTDNTVEVGSGSAQRALC